MKDKRVGWGWLRCMLARHREHDFFFLYCAVDHNQSWKLMYVLDVVIY